MKNNLLKNKYPELFSEIDVEKTLEIFPDLNLNKLTASSAKKIFWKCPNGHIYQSMVNKREYGRGCPYCSHQKILPGYNDLETYCKINNRQDVLDSWDYEKNRKSPAEIFPCNKEKYFFKCKNGHSFVQRLSDMVKHHAGCPYCANKQVLTGYNDLQTRYPDIANEFAIDLNNTTPDKVLFGTAEKYYWRCSKNPKHMWKASVVSRTFSKRNCPHCSHQHSIPELTIYEICKKYVDIDTVSGYKINNWEIDIYIPKLLCCVEYDGEHYHNSDIVKDRETRKNIAILTDKNKYTLFRIKETKDKNKLKLFCETEKNVNIFYINTAYNDSYFKRLSHIIKKIFNIDINFEEIKKEFKNIKINR